MDFYPAIDIKEGKIIRLKKGLLEFGKIYGADPLLKAREFVSCGAKWIHVVDIDGAFQGKTKNMEKIVEIKKKNKL